MPPVQSRFAAAGLVAGLAASAFVAPSTRGDRQLRAGGTSKAPARTRAPVSQQTGDGLAALAILGAGLAAVRGSRTQVNAAAVEVGDEKGFRKLRVSEIKHGRVGAAVAPQTATIGTTSTRSCLVKTDGACVISFDRFISTRVCSSALGAVGSACPEFGCAPPDGGWYNKHGRVAMMASIGLVAQHFVKFPFFENAPAGFSIMDKGEGVLGFFGIFLACAPLELWWRENPQKEPGNYGDPFGVNMYTEEMRMKELNNGRMAMISVLGIFAAEMATGKDAMQQFGL